MQVTFISHASVLVRTEGGAVLSDPWFEGKVFNNGWALVSRPHPVDYASIDYIWISHEHPDHLSFPTLKRIPEQHKRRLTILYQRHASPRIVEAIKKLGFARIVELPLYRWFTVAPGLDVLCGSHGQMDSFLAVRDRSGCVVDLNDCYFNAHQLRYIKRLVGDISLAFAQFSFANWVGNEADEIGESAQKETELRLCHDILQPQHLVPFASFVYFCNAENARMNAWINTPETIRQLDLRRLEFMYPGDTWDSNRPRFATQAAIDRYRSDWADLRIDPTPRQSATRAWRKL